MAFASTLAANLAILVFRPADLCRVGPVTVVLFGIAGWFIFIILAAAAGIAVGRADDSVPTAALTGLVVGAISGCALVALIPFGPAVMHRLLELNALCPGPSSGGGAAFSFGVGGSPPPGFVPPTPPPGFFGASPPPGAFEFDFSSGSAGPVLRAISTLMTIAVGIGFATGAAALGGLVGAATRPREPAG